METATYDPTVGVSTSAQDWTTTATADPNNSTALVSYEYPPLEQVWRQWGLQICLYSLILFLAVLGNTLVIVTLVQNTKMRTVTNVYLLNLSIADLLMGVICMPFTLVGGILQNFIFGSFMCRVVPYLQAVSVSVSAWTLVAMSVERYYAICHPLRSRAWQTRSHAIRLIAWVWGSALLAASPTLLLTDLIPMSQLGRFKCREQWPSVLLERGYMLFIDLTYLIAPLTTMVFTYIWITLALQRIMETEQDLPGEAECHNGSSTQISRKSSAAVPLLRLRHSNAARSLANKRRVIRMLFVVVLEFFVCWTPIYVINTAALFAPLVVYQLLGQGGISFFHLLACTSSCCNPLTYCFMNAGFRESFLAAFGCAHQTRRSGPSAAIELRPLAAARARGAACRPQQHSRTAGGGTFSSLTSPINTLVADLPHSPPLQTETVPARIPSSERCRARTSSLGDAQQQNNQVLHLRVKIASLAEIHQLTIKPASTTDNRV